MKGFRLMLVFAVGLMAAFSSCDPSTNKANLERLLSPASLPYTKHGKAFMVSSADPGGENNDRITIAPGATATILNVSGPGIITRIWFTVDSRDPHYLRKIALKMFWDDETVPSVNVPLGDFFGCGFEYSPYASQYLGMTSGGFLCYFPMPFEKSARIQVVNETDQEVFAFYYQINYMKLEGYLDRSVGYFHAHWNRSIRTDYDSGYTILNADGNGHIVGVNLNMQSYDGTLGFLEGNEMVYVDGEKKPSIVGTGTEDYFSGGWYFTSGEFAGPYNGLILKDDSLGRIAAYRLHVLDPIPFKKHILFTIEHGHANTEIADYSSTVYWYQLEDHLHLPDLPEAGMRVPLKNPSPVDLINAEEMEFDTRGIEQETVDVSHISPDWNGGKFLLLKSRDGESFSVELDRMFEDSYTIELFYTRGPEFGDVTISHNGEIAGSFSGYAGTTESGGKDILNNLRPRFGKIRLIFSVSGKAPESSGYYTGLDGIRIIPKLSFLPDWYLAGPFPNGRITETQRLGLDSVFPPEISIDTNMVYSGLEGKPIRWKYVNTPEDGYLSLRKYVAPNELVVTYALTYVYSLKEKDVLLYAGSDDGMKVIVNNKEVYRFLGIRIAEPDQVTIPVHLRVGWNKILLKVENNLGGYAFYARILDPGKTLYYSAKQQRPPETWIKRAQVN